MIKKLTFFIAVLLVIAFPLSALEAGGSLDVSGGAVMTDDTIIISPSAKLTGYIKVPFSGGNFSTEGYYKATGSVREDFTPVINSVADLSLLKLTFGGTSFSVNLGRFAFSDVTSSIFSMTSDGANFSVNAGLLKLNGYAGYTGFLNAKNTDMDVVWDYDADAIYPTGSKYAVFLANISAPNFFGGNTFAIEGIGALNLNGPAESGVSDGLNRYYGTASVSGPVSSSVYYSMSATGSVLKSSNTYFGIYARGSLVAYLPFKSMSLSAKGAWGSANFVGITNNESAGGMLDAGVALTIKPVDSLLLLASSDIYCNTVYAFEPSSVVWNALIKWQMLSDVSSFLSASQNIMLVSKTSSLTASVGVTLSF